MVFYKLYDRNDLTMADSGVLSDFTIDYDYISNNASTAKITKPSSGFHGDIISKCRIYRRQRHNEYA
jgi:hypothetical protein